MGGFPLECSDWFVLFIFRKPRHSHSRVAVTVLLGGGACNLHCASIHAKEISLRPCESFCTSAVNARCRCADGARE